jgi:hypothetical protein
MLKWVSILFFIIPFAPSFAADHSASKGRPPADKQPSAEEAAMPADPQETAEMEKLLQELSLTLGRVSVGEQPPSN